MKKENEMKMIFNALRSDFSPKDMKFGFINNLSKRKLESLLLLPIIAYNKLIAYYYALV